MNPDIFAEKTLALLDNYFNHDEAEKITEQLKQKVILMLSGNTNTQLLLQDCEIIIENTINRLAIQKITASENIPLKALLTSLLYSYLDDESKIAPIVLLVQKEWQQTWRNKKDWMILDTKSLTSILFNNLNAIKEKKMPVTKEMIALVAQNFSTNYIIYCMDIAEEFEQNIKTTLDKYLEEALIPLKKKLRAQTEVIAKFTEVLIHFIHAKLEYKAEYFNQLKQTLLAKKLDSTEINTEITLEKNKFIDQLILDWSEDKPLEVIKTLDVEMIKHTILLLVTEKNLKESVTHLSLLSQAYIERSEGLLSQNKKEHLAKMNPGVETIQSINHPARLFAHSPKVENKETPTLHHCFKN